MAYNVWIKIIWRCLILFQFTPAPAQDRDEEDDTFRQYMQEFFFTEAVYSQEKRELQFTFSNYYQQQNEIQLLMEYGFTDRLQMKIELSNDTNRDPAGLIGELSLLLPGEETQWTFNTALPVPFGRAKGLFEVHSHQEDEKIWQITPSIVLNTWKRPGIALGPPIPLFDDHILGSVARSTIEFEGKSS